MIPVDMLNIHDPISGSNGDCFRACIASILELPAADVPHFVDYNVDKEPVDTWAISANKWLSTLGYAYMEWPVSSQKDYEEYFMWRESMLGKEGAVYHVITGDSPNFEGTSHAVVGRNGIVVHDPAPSRKGVLTHNTYGFIIKM